MKKLCLIVGLFLTLTGTVGAQEAETDFKIRVFGGVDVMSPSTPVLSVQSVSATQVDLSWSTSTDNFSVGGYRVFRGGQLVATTTLATTTLQVFTDSGLTPSTTLTYFVQAFDTAFNYSSSSNIVTVITPGVIQPPEKEAVSGTVARVVVRDLLVETGLSTTSISLKTAFPARIEFRWGRSDLFELGYVVSSVFTRDTNFFLDSLEPGTTYIYEIVGFTPSGVETKLITDTFTTQEVSQITSPANVNRFVAETAGVNVNLSWSLPRDIDIGSVRIVRSHLDFPRFPTDGAVIYQGNKTEFIDESILVTYSPVYYTAFLYDSFGNVSSGAIAVAYALGATDEARASDGNISEVVVSDRATSTINFDRLEATMKMPELADILVFQGTRMFTMLDAPLVFNNNQSITIQIPAENVSGNLKSIIATIIDPTDNKKTYSFLLRVNKDRTTYEASFSGLGVVGSSQLKLEVYDYEAFVVATYQTPIIFNEDELAGGVLFPDIFFDHINFILLGIVLFFTTVLILLLVWRRENEDNQ